MFSTLARGPDTLLFSSFTLRENDFYTTDECLSSEGLLRSSFIGLSVLKNSQSSFL